MRAFCTLFDKNYLYQGVALYNSLKRFAGDFRLYALCMDPEAYAMLSKMKAGNLVPVGIEELLDAEVSAVHSRTTHGQFCWVCQPLICRFILDRYGCEMITYLEADSLFFFDPEVLFEELGDRSVSLVPHNYAPEFDNTGAAGKFCVQFNAFSNGDSAAAVLEYWKSKCFEYSKDKPFVYPGQTCLDDWPERFDCVKVIANPGAGVAPWNIQRFRFEIRDSAPYVDGRPVVFYHYHAYGRYENGSHELGNYPLPARVVECIYGTYVAEIHAAEEAVRAIDPTFSHRRSYGTQFSGREVLKSPSYAGLLSYLRGWQRKLRGTCNIYPDDFFSKN